jgi:hypothetical protein
LAANDYTQFRPEVDRLFVGRQGDFVVVADCGGGWRNENSWTFRRVNALLVQCRNMVAADNDYLAGFDRG